LMDVFEVYAALGGALHISISPPKVSDARKYACGLDTAQRGSPEMS